MTCRLQEVHMSSALKLPQRVIQLTLFQPSRNEPSWDALSIEVRQQVLRLLAECFATTSPASAASAPLGIAMSDKTAATPVAQGNSVRAPVLGLPGHSQCQSQRLQYAMQKRLQQLGWREIEVVDEDLGRSAAGLVARSGFERMVADVCLGKVGAVAAREVSRFARNSREWQQLVEVCRVVDTVLIDQETVYAPRQSNDRLLLGLKGSLSSTARPAAPTLGGRAEKARRGELMIVVRGLPQGERHREGSRPARAGGGARCSTNCSNWKNGANAAVVHEHGLNCR
jgi:DNA invertase Pin-like site-specific DNA recombinase